jgi:hypothetical protein
MKSEKKSKKKGSSGLLKRYNDAQAKSNVKVTAMKSGVDLLLGVGIGSGLAATLGIWSPLAGFLMMGTGHYLGDESGVLRVAGAATVAYGIAKSMENREAVRQASVNGVTLGSLAGGAKERLVQLKNEWVNALFIDKLTGNKTEERSAVSEELGDIDLSELDIYDQMNKQSAVDFELQKIRALETSEQDVLQGSDFEEDETDFAIYDLEEDSEDLDGLSYAFFEEDSSIDFNTL